MFAFACALAPIHASAQNDSKLNLRSADLRLPLFTAYRFGGHFHELDGDREFDVVDSSMQGVIVNIAASTGDTGNCLIRSKMPMSRTLNVLAAESRISVDVEELYFGGTYDFEGRAARPFIAVSVGASRFDPGPAELRAEDFLSVAFGGGVQLRPDKPLGVRLEGRVTATLVDSNSDIFCDGTLPGSSGCLIAIDGTTLTQWEFRAGLVFRFLIQIAGAQRPRYSER